MGLLNWLREKQIKHMMVKASARFQAEPMVYNNCIEYKISPDTVRNGLIREKAFKIWIRLCDMMDENKLKMSGSIRWKGAEVDLMKEGELTEEEYQSASALWFGLFSLMYEDCKERYYNGKTSC